MTKRSSPIAFLIGIMMILGASIKMVPYFVDTEGLGLEVVLQSDGAASDAKSPLTPAPTEADDTDDDGLIAAEDFQQQASERAALPAGHHYETRLGENGTTERIAVKNAPKQTGDAPILMGALLFGGLLIVGVSGGAFLLERHREQAEPAPPEPTARVSHTAATSLATLADEAPDEDLVGGAFVAGRYRLISKLGEGGMAAVYRGWDVEDRAWRAIKVLLPHFSKKRKIRKRFANEAATMQRISHRNVVEIFDVGVDAPLPFFVMEMARGGCLIDWIDTHGPMPSRMAVDVTIQVCKGVAAAHAIGVIHRDIKPQNILMTRRGLCKITDFGIAQIDQSSMTKTGSVLGTMGYMSPEQRTDAKHIDARADVYSIGATLYKMLTAGPVADLFVAEHNAKVLEGVPEPLVPVLIRCTAYNPDDRYDTVMALAKALHTARKSLPEVPVNTPSLAMPLQETELDALRAVPASEFEEISEIVEERAAGHTLMPRNSDNTTFMTED